MRIDVVRASRQAGDGRNRVLPVVSTLRVVLIIGVVVAASRGSLPLLQCLSRDAEGASPAADPARAAGGEAAIDATHPTPASAQRTAADVAHAAE